MNGERQFGPYRLVRQIAVGGMAELHLASARGIAGFEKYIALKMIHPNFSMDENFIEMLIDEAKISVQLQHVNIAQTFDLGRVGDTYYITMEYVDGADLYKLLRRAAEKNIPMPVDVAAFIAKEVANGLDYAHRRRDGQGRPMGIVHRDISPQNVLIAHSGEVKLVDFGIAKATMKARQTAVGVIKGKYYYMSPEQAWGDTVDHRTDIFSTGILLYESLTGQMLYLEEDLHRLLDLVRKASIAPPTSLRRDIPPQLERIVMNSLKASRDERYQTAGDMATDLERFLHVYSPVFTPAKLGDFFRRVLDDEPPPPPVAPAPTPRDMSLVTQRFETEQLLRERGEFSDENSVIFRMSELEKQGRAQQQQQRRGPALPLQAEPPAGGSDYLDDIEERTVISAPPGFGGMMGQARGGGDFAGSETDATLVGDEGGEDYDVDEAPTLQHESRQVQEMLATLNKPGQAARPPAAPRAQGEGSRRKGPAHPALSASVPQPAVSELRGNRPSRKTPPEGYPGADASQGGPSLLSALVGNAGVGAPVQRTPAPELVGPPAMPAGGPAPMPASPAPMPASSSPFPQPFQPNAPGAIPLVPSSFPAGFDPFSPLPRGTAPQTMTKQLQALELEEIPDAFKITRKRPKWLVSVVLGGVLLVAGIVIGVVLFTRGGETIETALVIDSTPSGASVKVNGQPLPEPTPTRWAGAAPNAEYTLAFELDGYTAYSKKILVGPDGGDVQVKVVLMRAKTTVTLIVQSTPDRAEIFINGKSHGSTPRTIPDLDPKQATELELRLGGYKSHREPLDWGKATELRRNITLQK